MSDFLEVALNLLPRRWYSKPTVIPEHATPCYWSTMADNFFAGFGTGQHSRNLLVFFFAAAGLLEMLFPSASKFLAFFVRTSVYHHVELPALGQPRRCLLLDALASSSLRKDVPAYVLAPDGRRVLGSVCRLTNRFWLTMLGRGFLDQTSYPGQLLINHSKSFQDLRHELRC